MGYISDDFDVAKETQNCIDWIKNWFDSESGNAKGIVIGISGGKDSTIVAKLCCEALGVDAVFGVLMPNGVQADIGDSIEVCKILGIRYGEVNVNDCYNGLISALIGVSEEATINIPPRLRMTTLYAIAQSKGYRVVGTGNFSERYIGYCTKWGDMASDFNPIANFTSDEVVAIGDYLKLPYDLVHKIPADGLCGQSDEERFGFTYEDLNRYIRTGICENNEIKARIDKMHEYSLHKIMGIPIYDS